MRIKRVKKFDNFSKFLILRLTVILQILLETVLGNVLIYYRFLIQNNDYIFSVGLYSPICSTRW